MRPKTVFRTSRAVRDAAKLNQLVDARPFPLLLLLEDDELLGEAVTEGDLMGGGSEFGENGGEPVDKYVRRRR